MKERLKKLFSNLGFKEGFTLSFLSTFILLSAFLFSTNTSAQTTKLVCIDPGHGGDTGAYNETYDLWEDDINLDVSFRLRELLSDSYEVTMTRETDVSLSNNDRYTHCNGDNEYERAADILVSVHTNSSSDSSVDGSMALYFHKDDEVLAGAIYEIMYPSLDNVTWEFTDFGLDRFASGVLLKSDMPAAMMESVFMSHDGEAELLLDTSESSRRQEIAESLYQGIENYFANYYDGESDDGGNGGGNGNGNGRDCTEPPCNNK